MKFTKVIAYGLLLVTVSLASACGGTGEQTITAPDEADASDENIVPEEPSGNFPSGAQAEPAPVAEEAAPAEPLTFQKMYLVPAVMESAPHEGETDVGVTAILRVTFNQPMDPESVNTHFKVKIFALLGWSDVAGTISTLDDQTYVFTPADSLKKGALYGIVVESGVKTKAGVLLSKDYNAGFTTVEN